MEANDVNYNWHLDRFDGGNRTCICNNSWYGVVWEVMKKSSD